MSSPLQRRPPIGGNAKNVELFRTLKSIHIKRFESRWDED